MSYRTWPMLPFALFGHQTRRIACRGVDSVYTGDLDSGKAEKLVPIRRVSQRDLNFAVEEAESERERESEREEEWQMAVGQSQTCTAGASMDKQFVQA